MEKKTQQFISRKDVKFIIFIIGIVASGIVWATRLELKVVALENDFAEYPSEDWFELKFQNIAKEFEELKK